MIDLGKIQKVCKFIETVNQTWPKYKSRRDWTNEVLSYILFHGQNTCL